MGRKRMQPFGEPRICCRQWAPASPHVSHRRRRASDGHDGYAMRDTAFAEPLPVEPWMKISTADGFTPYGQAVEIRKHGGARGDGAGTKSAARDRPTSVRPFTFSMAPSRPMACISFACTAACRTSIPTSTSC